MEDKTFKEQLLEHHANEMLDHDRYIELSKEAAEHGLMGCAGILKDMAHDEETHAEAIAHILEKEVH